MTSITVSDIRAIVTHKEIALEYVKGFFALDLLSSIPFNFFTDGSGSANKLLRILKIPRLIRMLKLAKVMKLKSLYKGTNFSYFLKINGGIIKVISLALITILILHFFACVFSALAVYDTDNYLQSWIFRYKGADFADSEVYLTAYYFGMTTLTTVGYGDITAFTSCNKVDNLQMKWWSSSFGCLSVSCSTRTQSA